MIHLSDGEARPELAPGPVAPPPIYTSVVAPATPEPTQAYTPSLREALARARAVLHIRDLRPGQAEVIESVLAGRDTLAVMPTGSGKSLTYQLPSLWLPGPTLVVSPLLALIEDQVGKMKAASVPVARIDSTRTAKERAADLEAVREGKTKLVLITPESVCSPAVQESLEGVKFSLFCVDEAHCVSQWGHDFRPSYLGLRRAAEILGRPPILGLTATATPAIAEDILVQLGMKNAHVCRVSFHRPNLAFDVRKVAGEADKLRVLGKLIQRLRRPGIVYCATVRAVDDLYVALRHGKIPVERYNGKMTTEEREGSQASFMASGRKVVMIATNAFGLGVDKPDIRYIIHYQMPGSVESYVQEAGRAGRDGKPARCVLLFQPDDIAIQEHFLKEAHPTRTQARLVAEGLYAWSDEGKEVSVRDLALSMALPERRVRVVLSVLEAMGVAKEVRAARWAGVEPRPTREAIDKAASVFETLSVADCLRIARARSEPPSLLRASPVLALPAAARAVVESSGLAERLGEEARFLSHGLKQALELAMVLALEPRVLLLDEPTAGLTRAERQGFAGVLTDLVARERLCVLIIEHDLDFVRQISSRIILLHQGRVALDGPVADVVDDPLIREIYTGNNRPKQAS